MNMRRVKVLISGTPQKIVDIEEGETLADFRDRMAGPEMPLHRIETLYLNGSPVSDPSERTLTDGDVVGGAPKLEGGER